MFNIDKDSIKVYEESVIPAITFTVTDNQVEEDTIVVKIDGIVLSVDWKYIANIVELPDAQVRNNPTIDGRLITHASTVRPVLEYTDNNNKHAASKTKHFNTYKHELVFTLNDKVLEHIEYLRNQQKNNDVVLYFIFKVSYLKHSIKLGTYATKPIEDNNKIIMVSGIPTKYNNDNINLRILVNGDKEDRLLFYTVDEFRRQVIIPSNEWGRMTFKSH